jgi:hypothetical protein
MFQQRRGERDSYNTPLLRYHISWHLFSIETFDAQRKIKLFFLFLFLTGKKEEEEMEEDSSKGRKRKDVEKPHEENIRGLCLVQFSLYRITRYCECNRNFPPFSSSFSF